jgi:hypothetical protein
MLPSLIATDSTPCWRKKSFNSCWIFGFVVTSVATQRLPESQLPEWNSNHHNGVNSGLRLEPESPEPRLVLSRSS